MPSSRALATAGARGSLMHRVPRPLYTQVVNDPSQRKLTSRTSFLRVKSGRPHIRRVVWLFRRRASAQSRQRASLVRSSACKGLGTRKCA
jgi:hypothetical protein